MQWESIWEMYTQHIDHYLQEHAVHTALYKTYIYVVLHGEKSDLK